MAVYSTFFVATQGELELAFPTWFLPLAAPVRRVRVNPFTGTSESYESWEPDEALARPGSLPADTPNIVAIQGDYQDYLRSRVPPGVQTFLCHATKNVLSPHVEELLASAAGRKEEQLRPALFPPGGDASGKSIDSFPGWGIDTLRSMRDEDIAGVARELADSGWFADDGWAEEDCAQLLRGLRRLSAHAHARHAAMFLLTEA